eukprot:scaffold304090_cov33-Tisochrysis_lutea.AAC.1
MSRWRPPSTTEWRSRTRPVWPRRVATWITDANESEVGIRGEMIAQPPDATAETHLPFRSQFPNDNKAGCIIRACVDVSATRVPRLYWPTEVISSPTVKSADTFPAMEAEDDDMSFIGMRSQPAAIGRGSKAKHGERAEVIEGVLVQVQ